ncbi:MAG TPA: hypothetical protein VMR33_05445 [Candidatus Baltobacteraceae bacterium]|jgi:hypothetical protein|nr:hypothetical protein [Candidatus Baltobacteraceae bacterium]
MKLTLHNEERRQQRSERGIALVITLLMLSAITFLAVAFLAMSRRDRAAVTATMDVDAARNMSDAAFNRAQAEIIAQMLAHGDALSYDYMVSRNYINPVGFVNKDNSITNVNYDMYTSGQTLNMSANPTAWAQNIANLYYDPRPPVFVVTNPAYPNNSDFRFWVDINRNGRFETNGFLPYILDNGLTNGTWQYFNGEPEWIGVLRDPLNRHSATDPFIGRFAYMVLPIGKTLDFNYIHNWAKGNYADIGILTNDVGNGNYGNGYEENDGFARDQGIASYELNLAALLDVVSPDAYRNGFLDLPGYVVKPYRYFPPFNAAGTPNTGYAFDDAESFVHYRYWFWPETGGSPYLGFASLRTLFPSLISGTTNFNTYGIDAYCLTAPTGPPFDVTNTVDTLVPTDKRLWPGSYSSNMFYDPQDLFDPNRTSVAFTNRMLLAGSRTNSEDRYTFERLLSNIGMGSTPEYGVWVYGDSNQLTLRTKVNLNFDNTAQIQSPNAPYAPMPTNLINWTPLGFFTNAAELLLRSQSFTFTNYVTILGTNEPSGTFTANFGVTNIPIFRVYYPGVQYNEAIHRILQLAANIYSATVSSNYPPGETTLPSPGGALPSVRHPFIFRPLFQVVNPGTSNWGVNIVGYTNVTNPDLAYVQMQQPFLDLTSNNVVRDVISDYVKRGVAFNLSGIPWVVSAEKGLPQFYQYSYDNRILFTRKVLFSRRSNGSGEPATNLPPEFTNQFYVMAISNNFGIGGWNPYPTPFAGSTDTGGGTTYYLSNYVTIELTNNYRYGYVTNFSYTYFPNTRVFHWPAWSGVPNQRNSNGFVTFFSTNITTVPSCYFSESQQRLIFFTNNIISSNSFLPQDTNQTGWPVHNWTLNVTNHVVYALFDGSATAGNGVLLDFVNLGPFGSSVSITNQIMNGSSGGPPDQLASSPWAIGTANDLAGSPKSTGLINQINTGIQGDSTYWNNLTGTLPDAGGWVFGPDYNPSNVVVQMETWVANDPLVHYTIGDLKWPVYGDSIQPLDVEGGMLLLPVTNSVGSISRRFNPWPTAAYYGSPGADMLFKDPLIILPVDWQFPTNKFPSVGWLGRVHRGTPWQTVYFKSDNPGADQGPLNSWVDLGPLWTGWTSSPWSANREPDTYPTNDWVLPDLFTTALSDNTARGLLSVNQTNDGAWAAALAGVIMVTNADGGIAIDPTNVYQFVDVPGGINMTRTNEPNGLFHKVGDILATPALTVSNMFLANVPMSGTVSGFPYSDDVVERIPQQILGLLKVGEPQFVIYAWGESLRPKNLYLSSPNNNLCTNYEITGEFLSRTVCHVVHTNGIPKMVIDSYNVEPSD